jgi:hypothetical protein
LPFALLMSTFVFGPFHAGGCIDFATNAFAAATPL